MTNEKVQEKKTYSAPTLTRWGTVADLTKNGRTFRGDDGKIGSVLNLPVAAGN